MWSKQVELPTIHAQWVYYIWYGKITNTPKWVWIWWAKQKRLYSTSEKKVETAVKWFYWSVRRLYISDELRWDQGLKMSEDVDETAHQQPGWCQRKGCQKPSIEDSEKSVCTLRWVALSQWKLASVVLMCAEQWSSLWRWQRSIYQHRIAIVKSRQYERSSWQSCSNWQIGVNVDTKVTNQRRWRDGLRTDSDQNNRNLRKMPRSRLVIQVLYMFSWSLFDRITLTV